MIFLKKMTLFIFLAFAFLSCDEKKHIKDYYFPIESLEKGMVYEYHSTGDVPLGPIYWYYYGTQEGRTKFLNGVYAEADFIPRQIIKEEFTKYGILLDSVSLVTPDSTGAMIKKEGEVQVANVFPFSVVDNGGIFLYKVKFDFPEEGNSATLIKNRQFENDSTWLFDNKLYDCIQFNVKELIEYGNDQEGYTEPGFSGEEYYLKSIGLVHYKKRTEEGDFMEYTLLKRYPLEEADPFLRQSLLKLGIGGKN